jgi:glutamate dehydrogenase (NADP+)
MENVLAATVAQDLDHLAFHQSVREELTGAQPVFEHHRDYRSLTVLERLVEPERTHLLEAWMDDVGEVHVHCGPRVELSSAIGIIEDGCACIPPSICRWPIFSCKQVIGQYHA